MYTAKDFDILPWNPLKDKKDLESKWKFKVYQEFSLPLDRRLNRDLFYNIMCLVYHRNSQLVIDIDNVSIRYQKALELLNVAPLADGKYERHIQDLIEYKSAPAIKMIYRFCSVIGDLKYKTFISLSTAYDKKLSELSEVNDVEEMGKFNKAIDEIIVNIEKYRKEIFAKDEQIADESNDEILSYARMPGYAEMVAFDKIKIEKE